MTTKRETHGRCEPCANHYGDNGPCDEGKPLASPHRRPCACGTNHPAADVSGTCIKTLVQPEPRIVAECWTCWRDRNPERPITNHAGEIYSDTQAARHRAAGHDVREVR